MRKMMERAKHPIEESYVHRDQLLSETEGYYPKEQPFAPEAFPHQHRLVKAAEAEDVTKLHRPRRTHYD
jgi:hypothetical protein